MFAKTDLAKFENVWDDNPRFVNLGAQKNFARFAGRIGKEWTSSPTAPDAFNEFYFRRAVARAIIFRTTEKLVSEQSWYNGGYRANIVAYAIASIAEVCRQSAEAIDYARIWDTQAVPPGLAEALATAAKFVNDDLTNPPQGISNISEWAKKEASWTRIRSNIATLDSVLPDGFRDELVSPDEIKSEKKDARKIQKLDNGINDQMRVIEIGATGWRHLLQEGTKRRLLTEKEMGVLAVAEKMPARIPTERQSAVLMEILDKLAGEGVTPG